MINLQRILFPTDFSEYSGDAAKYACSLAEQFEAELHVLHVLETHHSATPVFGGGLAMFPRVHESRDAALKLLEQVLDPPWQESHAVTRATADGAPFVEIIRYAKSNDIDLIVMGTHGRSGLKHALIGSVAERVVNKAPCPVLTIRPAGHVFEAP